MNSQLNFTQTIPSVKFNWGHLILIPTCVFAGIIGAFWLCNIDKQFSAFLAKQPGGFPFAGSERYEFWFHVFPKIISGSVVIAIFSLAVLLIPGISWLERIPNSLWQKLLGGITRLAAVIKIRHWLARLPTGTAVALWLTLIAIVFSSEMIGHLKRNSSVYCPIEIQAYGGTKVIDLASVTEPFPSFGANGGKCWPGGHSITGFIFVAGFFGFHRLGKQRAAWTTLAGALVYGNFLGLTQVIRGQHYLSHQLWSVLVCWLCSLIIFWIAEKTINRIKINTMKGYLATPQ